MKKYMFMIMMILITGVFAATIYIPGDYATIQAGINASEDGDEIIVSPGTYIENINFAGKAVILGSLFYTTQDTSYISQTIIDGNQDDSVVRFDSREDFTSVLTGFTITNGLADNGGGIFCHYSSPGLDNVTITGNTAGWYGGGIFCGSSSPSLENVTISDNSAGNEGGGIYCLSSSPSLENVTITDNSAGNNGGGIKCLSSSPSLVNVTITGNTAEEEGGGIYCNNSSSPIILNCIVWNNSPQEVIFSSIGDPNTITIAYSDIDGGEGGIVTNNNGTVNWLEDNIDADPLFVDALMGDYHLTEYSPCIDTGTSYFEYEGEVLVYLSEDEYCGIAPDMGAYETVLEIVHNLTQDIWYDTIQGGIDGSNNGDIIIVKPGIYVENINFNGKAVILGSLFYTTQDTSYISQTIIDGNQNGSVVTFASEEDSTSVLTGFTITNGQGSGNPDYTGGGITCINSSSPSLTNVTITGNSSESRGGGIYCNSSSPSLENVTITGNSSENIGGGIYCKFSSPDLENVTITDNSADRKGGGIFCSYSNPSLENVTIANNSAVGNLTNGGGIYCSYSSPSLENVTITDNSADFGGGIYCRDNSSLSLENVTITNNSASYSGGIYCNDSSPILENVTITGNSSVWFGGICCNDSSCPILKNVTITGNSAEHSCGGIYCQDNSYPILVNCLFWNNSPREVKFSSSGDPNTITIAYSDIDGGEEGILTYNNGTVNWLEGNIDADPLFVDVEMGNYHLTEYSPCIDTGIAYFEYEGEVLVDLSEEEYWGIAPDMGAYEYGLVNTDEVIIQNSKLNIQNYPNPFNPETNIVFELSFGSNVLIEIYNIKGQKVTTLVNEPFEAGSHIVTWNASDQSSGIYLLRFNTAERSETKKLILLK